jgi:hypothetical protein
MEGVETMLTKVIIRVAKAGKSYEFDWETLPEATRDHVIMYGLRQILNDSTASAPSGESEEGKGLADKRYDALLSGMLRASGTREGDPVKSRAKALALAAVLKGKNFLAWVGTQKVDGKPAKLSDKIVMDEARKRAAEVAAKPGNPFTVQAELDVKAQRELLASADIDL